MTVIMPDKSLGLINFIVLSFLLQIVNGQLLGLPENVPCGNAGGTCRRLRECPIVGNPRQSRPQLCSFVDREPVVCCPPSRAQEMCITYDRMACNAVDIARRKRQTKDEYKDRRGLPISLESLSAKETDFTTTVKYQTTTETLKTTTKIRQSTRSTKKANTPSTSRTTSGPSTTTTLSYDQLLNDSLTDYGEGSVRMLIYGLGSNVDDNDVAETKVVGGTAANAKELPYMALLGYGSQPNIEWSCGASIISENFIMSAAHCANNALLGPARWARVGELDLSREDSPHQDIAIVSRHVHPGYREPAVYNDIAVFRLARRLVFSSWIQPICLQVAPQVLAARGVAAGWGRTDFVGDTSERLLKVDLTLVDGAQCRTLLGRAGRFLPQGVNMETQICAGEREGGKDTCTGDSGGPLVVQGSGRCIRTQIGVVSFGRQCAMPNTPGIYTKVSSFVPWIENIVWPR